MRSTTRAASLGGLIGLAIFRVAWKHAIRRYSAVGG